MSYCSSWMIFFLPIALVWVLWCSKFWSHFLSSGEVIVDSSRSCRAAQVWNIGAYEKSYLLDIFLRHVPILCSSFPCGMNYIARSLVGVVKVWNLTWKKSYAYLSFVTLNYVLYYIFRSWCGVYSTCFITEMFLKNWQMKIFFEVVLTWKVFTPPKL